MCRQFRSDYPWHDGCREARERASLRGLAVTWLLVAGLAGGGAAVSSVAHTAGDGSQIASHEPAAPARSARAGVGLFRVTCPLAPPLRVIPWEHHPPAASARPS